MIPLAYAYKLDIRLCYNIAWVILISLGLIIVIDALYFVSEIFLLLILKINDLKNYCKNVRKLDSLEKKRHSRHIKEKGVKFIDPELNDQISSDIVV